MKKILITGGAGFIGFHLAKKLADDNKVIIIDNLARGRMDDDFLKLTKHKNVEFIQTDLTDTRVFIKLDTDFDYVYHLAAVIGVRNVAENPDKVLYVNAITTLNLFEYAKQLKKLKKILFSSTSEIYAGTLKHFGIQVPTNEEVPLTLLNVKSERTTYMLSKMYGESICFNYGKKYKIPFTIVRYHNVYGPRMGFMHVIPEMFIKIKNNDKIEVPSANHTRAMCFVDDAIEMTIRACEFDNTNKEIFHIGNQSQEIKIKELVKTIAKVLDKDIQISELPETSGSTARRCPDISKINKFTNYKPQIDLKQGISKTYNWYKNKLDNKYE